MNALTKILIRILGVVFIAIGLTHTEYILLIYAYLKEGQKIFAGENIIFIAYYIAQFAVWILIGALLLVFSNKISKMITGTAEDQITIKIDLKNLQSIAFSVIGMALLATSVPTLIMQIYNALKHTQDQRSSMLWAYPASNNSLLIEYIIRTVAGLLLLFGSKGISKIFRVISGKGLYKPYQEETIIQEDKENTLDT